MENRIWKALGFWAMGLLLFIATILIIRWVIVFVNWSPIDSGWAQAIGSVAAIMASFFLFQRQRQHEIQEARDEELRRRFLAVQTVTDVAYRAIDAIREVFNAYECDFVPGIAPDLAPRLPELRMILDRFAEPTADRIVVLVAMDFSTALVETQDDIKVHGHELRDYVATRIKERLDTLRAMTDRLVAHRTKLGEACRRRGIDLETDVEAIIAQ